MYDAILPINKSMSKLNTAISHLRIMSVVRRKCAIKRFTTSDAFKTVNKYVTLIFLLEHLGLHHCFPQTKVE